MARKLRGHDPIINDSWPPWPFHVPLQTCGLDAQGNPNVIVPVIIMIKEQSRQSTLPPIFTIGHSTRSIAEFLILLQQVAVDLVIDVRSIPRSRTNPQFNADALPATLAAAGISYQHLPALGGLRHRKKGATPSLNTFWQVPAFRNYADYAATETFRTGLNELRALSRDNCCAIMCAEAVWWRCHRRIIADYLLMLGVPVMHIMGVDKIDPAKLTPGARVKHNGTLLYPTPVEVANPGD